MMKIEKEITSSRQLARYWYESHMTLRSSAPLGRDELKRKTGCGQYWEFVSEEINHGNELPYSYNVIRRVDSSD